MDAVVNNKEVTINGWVYNSRSSGKIGFLMLRDGFGIIQCIVEKNKLGDESFSLFKTLTHESSIKVNGLVVKNERALGGFEILVDSFEIYQLSIEYFHLNKDQKKYPLEVFFCESCCHVQLIEVVDPKELFENYVYVSGTSTVFVNHFLEYAKSIIEKYNKEVGLALT